MNPTRIYTARYLLPICAPPVEDGALCVRDGRILAAGRRSEVCREAPGVPCTDFGDAVILPPLVNAHTHLELTHFPRWRTEAGETAVPESFVDWILQVIRVKRALPLDAYRPSLEEGLRLSLAAGTGAIGDILSCFPAREAYRGSPLRGRTYLEALGRDPARCRQLLAAIADLLEEGSFGPLEAGLSPHSPYTLSREYLEDVFDFCRRRRLPAAIHLAESGDESVFLAESAGPLAQRLYPAVGWEGMVPPPARRTSVAYLAETGGLGPRTLLIHGVQVTDEDVRRIAAAGASVVLCPRSNHRLQVGRAPVGRYLAAGVNLALGTDSLASCDSLSIWDEIAFARRVFGGEVDPARLLQMATLGGARALGVEKSCGALLPGLAADFQVVRPAVLPAADALEEALCDEPPKVAALYLHGRNVLQ